jgi:hypothetical protein
MAASRLSLCTGALLAIAGGAAWCGEAPDGLGPPLGDTELAALRGGTDTTRVFNDMRLRGTTSNNSAVNVRTGSNTIADDALGQVAGIPVVIQNTGANVLIQNAVIVNVQFR